MAEEEIVKQCTCIDECPVCGGQRPHKPSVTRGSFWDLWAQKLLRNVASMKFQWLLLLYIPVIWGMFNIQPGTTPPAPWISAGVGLSFLGGGFVTLATTRIIARTKLTNGTNGDLDTDK